MPISKPVKKQKILLPSPNVFDGLAMETKKMILHHLSTDNLITYMDVLIRAKSDPTEAARGVTLEQVVDDEGHLEPGGGAMGAIITCQDWIRNNMPLFRGETAGGNAGGGSARGGLDLELLLQPGLPLAMHSTKAINQTLNYSSSSSQQQQQQQPSLMKPASTDLDLRPFGAAGSGGAAGSFAAGTSGPNKSGGKSGSSSGGDYSPFSMSSLSASLAAAADHSLGLKQHHNAPELLNPGGNQYPLRQSSHQAHQSSPGYSPSPSKVPKLAISRPQSVVQPAAATLQASQPYKASEAKNMCSFERMEDKAVNSGDLGGGKISCCCSSAKEVGQLHYMIDFCALHMAKRLECFQTFVSEHNKSRLESDPEAETVLTALEDMKKICELLKGTTENT